MANRTSSDGPRDELQEFAKDLRELRAKAGLDYPEMAELSHYTMKTLASAAGGLKLPTLPVTSAYVRACGGDVAEWEDRWQRVATAVEPAGDDSGPDPDAAGPAGAGSPADAATGHPAEPRGAAAEPGRAQEQQQRPTHQGPPQRQSPPQQGPPQHHSPQQQQGPPQRPPGPRPQRPSQQGPPPPTRDDQVYVITSAAPRRPQR